MITRRISCLPVSIAPARGVNVLPWENILLLLLFGFACGAAGDAAAVAVRCTCLLNRPSPRLRATQTRQIPQLLHISIIPQFSALPKQHAFGMQSGLVRSWGLKPWARLGACPRGGLSHKRTKLFAVLHPWTDFPLEQTHNLAAYLRPGHFSSS